MSQAVGVFHFRAASPLSPSTLPGKVRSALLCADNPLSFPSPGLGVLHTFSRSIRPSLFLFPSPTPISRTFCQARSFSCETLTAFVSLHFSASLPLAAVDFFTMSSVPSPLSLPFFLIGKSMGPFGSLFVAFFPAESLNPSRPLDQSSSPFFFFEKLCVATFAASEHMCPTGLSPFSSLLFVYKQCLFPPLS